MEDTLSTDISEKTSKGKSPMRHTQRVLLRCLLALIVVFILFTWVIGVVLAPNDDMQPRISGNDLVIYYRLDNDPQAGDVIVINKNDTIYLGRVIAAGGDIVEILDEGGVRINGHVQVETDIFFSTYPLEGFTEYPVILDEDQCFVLSDYRSGGEDSRYYGPVQTSEILGTVITIVRRNGI